MPNPENIEKHKFKEGESGNPAGRPKGSRNLSTILKAMLEEDIEIENEDGTKEKKQFQDAIIQKLVKKAVNGEIKAITEIFDRTEGKAKQEISMNLETRKNVDDLFPSEDEFKK